MTSRRIARVFRNGAALLVMASLPAFAAEGPPAAPSLVAALAGNTLSGVLFVPRETGKGETLDRVVFQAYLRPDGSTLMRRWEPAHDAYSDIASRQWRVKGRTLCLDFPMDERVPALCIEVHIWGPRIAGNTTGKGQFAILDANIEPGNTVSAGR